MNLTLGDIINNVLTPIILIVTQILAAFALLAFFWGVAMFIWHAGDEKKRAQGRYVMIWGIIGMFVLLSIGGMVAILRVTFGFDERTDPRIDYPSATAPFKI